MTLNSHLASEVGNHRTTDFSPEPIKAFKGLIVEVFSRFCLVAPTILDRLNPFLLAFTKFSITHLNTNSWF
jgi:hypothetical protein